MAFQLDQCLDSKRFARECAAEGHCQIVRLPPALRNADDPQLLHALAIGANPLVTFDRALPHEHTVHIPEDHPGIIILSNFPAPQTMTIRIAQRLLARLKSEFLQWHQVSWKNSIVEFTTVGVEIWHVHGARLLRDGYLALGSSDWQNGLSDALKKNSQRQPRLGTSD